MQIKLRKSTVNIEQLKIGKEWEGIMKRKESGYPVKEEDTHRQRRGSIYRVIFLTGPLLKMSLDCPLWRLREGRFRFRF